MATMLTLTSGETHPPRETHTYPPNLNLRGRYHLQGMLQHLANLDRNLGGESAFTPCFQHQLVVLIGRLTLTLTLA